MCFSSLKKETDSVQLNQLDSKLRLVWNMISSESVDQILFTVEEKRKTPYTTTKSSETYCRINSTTMPEKIYWPVAGLDI